MAKYELHLRNAKYFSNNLCTKYNEIQVLPLQTLKAIKNHSLYVQLYQITVQQKQQIL